MDARRELFVVLYGCFSTVIAAAVYVSLLLLNRMQD